MSFVRNRLVVLSCASALSLIFGCSNLHADGTNVAYAGSSSCQECHAGFYQLWAPSHHGLAMQPFRSARPNLASQTNAIRVGTNHYRADLDKAVMIERGNEKTYPMQEALGGKDVFYFLTPFERGRLQVLPLGFDVRRQEWFDMAASAARHFELQTNDVFQWTEAPYTFNTACYNCHVSQLTNHYDLKSDTYHTTWTEPGINCETCHGSAAQHVTAARQTPKGQPLKNLDLASFKKFDSDQINSLCGSCHAKMYPITGTFSPGAQFFDHFGLLTLEQPDFYPDGRDLGENFTMTTWRLSPCVKSSRLNCVTCHTSSGRYRFAGVQANDACLPCHKDKVADAPAHSHHATNSDGSKCVGCHMSTTEFARMRRSDHSMRPPTPATTMAFGSPNACNLCHTNKDAAWADQKVREWHPDDYQAPAFKRASLIAAARKGDWSKLADIVDYLSRPERQEIWATSLLQLLRGCDQEAKWAGIVPCLKDRSPLVRAAAVDAMAERLSEAIDPLLTATHDSSRLVRIRAASALAAAPEETVPEADRPALKKATDELLASFFARPDDIAAHYNLGNFYLESHRLPQAIEAFKTACQRRPQDIPPLVNLAMAYNQLGSNELAEASLRSALKLEPTNPVVNLNLGMLLGEMDRLPEAEQAFRNVIQADPKSAVAAFNLGVLLSKEHPDEALLWCQKALTLRPDEPKYAYTLAYFQYANGKTTEAIVTLEKLLEPGPASAQAYDLLISIYAKQKQFAAAKATLQRAANNAKLTDSERAGFRRRLERLSN